MFTLIGSLILISVIVLSVLLICGLPLGELTMGGRYKVWPKKLRMIAISQLITQIFALLILFQSGGVMPAIFPEKVIKIICFIFAGFFLINTFMNAVSKSKKEKRIMTPLSALCAISFFIAGLNMLFCPLKKEIKLTGNYEPVYQDYWITKGESEIQVRAWYPKKYNGKDGSAKVMIFSHGSCGTIDNNVSLYKEISSNGYVVLAPAHPGSASVMTKSDGSKVRVSSEFIKEMTSVNPNGDAEKAYQIFQKWIKERMEDLNLVVDDFKTKCQNPQTEFERISDASSFIVAGHSLGGAAAYAMARIRTDIRACIALESPCMYDVKGVLDGKFVFDDSPYNVPLLNIYTDSSYPHLKDWMQYKNNEMLLSAKNSISLYYKGAYHMSICDLSLASPILAAILGGGIPKVNAVTQLTQLNTDVMAFIKLQE